MNWLSFWTVWPTKSVECWKGALLCSVCWLARSCFMKIAKIFTAMEPDIERQLPTNGQLLQNSKLYSFSILDPQHQCCECFFSQLLFSVLCQTTTSLRSIRNAHHKPWTKPTVVPAMLMLLPWQSKSRLASRKISRSNFFFVNLCLMHIGLQVWQFLALPIKFVLTKRRYRLHVYGRLQRWGSWVRNGLHQ